MDTTPKEYWQSVSQAPAAGPDLDLMQYRVVRADLARLDQHLADAPAYVAGAVPREAPVLTLPLPDAEGTVRVRVMRSGTMSPGLAARFPQIRSYVGEGADDPGVRVRIDHNPQGFFAMITRPGQETCYVSPHTQGDTLYHVCYRRADLRPGARPPFYEPAAGE